MNTNDEISSTKLVKTDHGFIRKAKITLQCELKPGYYTYRSDGDYPNLSAIAEALYDIDYDYLSPNGESITTLDTTTPVGYRGYNHKVPHWLVIKITAPEELYKHWEDFLAGATAKIIRQLAITGSDCIATIEYNGNEKFVVMTDIGEHDETDYIEWQKIPISPPAP